MFWNIIKVIFNEAVKMATFRLQAKVAQIQFRFAHVKSELNLNLREVLNSSVY